MEGLADVRYFAHRKAGKRKLSIVVPMKVIFEEDGVMLSVSPEYGYNAPEWKDFCHKLADFIANELPFIPGSPRIDYYEYIGSPEWKEKAHLAKEAAGWRCRLCNKEGDDFTLRAHHRTYERLGCELLDDITVLCAECHDIYESNKKWRR